MKCVGCHVPVESDGHGELVHVIQAFSVLAYRYGCEAPSRSTEYPVAH